MFVDWEQDIDNYFSSLRDSTIFQALATALTLRGTTLSTTHWDRDYGPGGLALL